MLVNDGALGISWSSAWHVMHCFCSASCIMSADSADACREIAESPPIIDIAIIVFFISSASYIVFIYWHSMMKNAYLAPLFSLAGGLKSLYDRMTCIPD
ncbi:hypothetical protein D3C81_1024930 [compost metagenome]